MAYRLLVALVVLAALLTPGGAAAQTASQGADGRLIITVVDPTGAVIPGAKVTVTSLDSGTKGAPLPPTATSDKGVATVEGLLPGRYRIQAEFAGFEIGVLSDVRIRRGDNKHVVILPLKGVEESVNVTQNAQAAAADPRGNSFKTVLTKEEIQNLSDDPAEMAQQLQDLAGGNATIRVDSFAGAPLPPKAMIKSIHIVRDAFAAENHSAENEGIDIITQPGIGQLSGGLSSRLRDGSLSARSPFTAAKGPERQESLEGNMGGTLIKGKSSFALSVDGRNAFDTPNLYANLPGGTKSEILNLRRPSDNWTIYGLVDYALTRDQTLRVAYDQSSRTAQNLGVGGPNLIDRAFSSESQDHEFRAQVVGPFGRRTFANTRLQVQWQNTDTLSAVQAQTIIVNGGFNSGGANVRGGRHPKTLEFASDIDYVRGMNTVRTGLLLDAGKYRSNDATDYLGTYTFSSVDAFVASQPSTYTLRLGDPLVQYSNIQAGAYIQDDIRVRKSLTLSPGVRFEAQNHLKNDNGHLDPRMGVTWAPFKNGRTTLRGSVGVFHNWLNANTYEQTLRVDGVRQRELFIVNPSYPSPGAAGTATTTTTNKYLLGDDVHMPRTVRVSAGIDQTISPKIRVNASYSNYHAGVLRGRNLNAPVGGVRPDPAFANEIEVLSDASLHSQQLSTTLNVNLAGGLRNANAARWNPRRTTFRLSYWIARQYNNAEGAFVAPPSGSLDTEWAPAPNDRRHRFQASVNSQALKNLNASLSVNGNTGTPFTITTGSDNNGDSLFNDRPVGVGRDSVRTASQATVSGNLSYSMNLGTPAHGSPAMGAFMQERGGDRGGDRGGAIAGRYRLVFTLSVNNLTNRPNYTGYSGVMTSRSFLTPTSVQNPRKIDLGISVRF